MARRWLLLGLALAASCDRRGAVIQETAPPRVVVAAEPARADAGPEVVEGRVLTDREIALLQPIYGAGVDLSLVRVIPAKLSRFQGDDTYMTPENSIYAPGSLFEEDFAAPGIDPYLQAVFVHELAHVWQHQSGLDVVAAGFVSFVDTKGRYGKGYAYALGLGRDLTEYAVEQQASILEDWFLIRVWGLPPASLQNPPDDPGVRDREYQDVLASFLADPTYSRKLGPDELLRRHAAASEQL
jgi:hypothetical protein